MADAIVIEQEANSDRVIKLINIRQLFSFEYYQILFHIFSIIVLVLFFFVLICFSTSQAKPLGSTLTHGK